MSVQELRAESQRRGLGTARARADLIQRLTDHDTERDGIVESDFADTAGAGEDAAVSGELTPPAEAGDTGASPERVRSFRKTFQAEPGGPDEETHLAYRDATRRAAVEAGLIPRGDARLAETRDGAWVYEILVRQVT